MCYAAPGPRCASSSLKRLNRIVSNRSEYSPEDYQEAILDYYSTPAGFALIELREQQDQESTDLIGHEIVDVAEFKALCSVYREKKHAALYEGEESELHDYPRIQGSQDFCPDGELRKNISTEDKEAYAEEATGFIDSIPVKALVPLRWVTSDGSGILNQYLVNGYEGVRKNSYLHGNSDQPDSLYSEEGIKRSISAVSEVIESHKREEPIVVYRGLNVNMFSDEFASNLFRPENARALQQEVESVFIPGETYEMKNFASTTVNPGLALRFATSNVVLEMKSRSVIPLGGVSNWGFSESEMLSNQGTRFRVLGVKKAPYQLRNGSAEEMIVVQMEEID